MSGGSSANNSWTILTPEDTVTETLRPLAEGTEHHEESFTSKAGSCENQPASGAGSTEELSVEANQVSEDSTAELSGGTSKDHHASEPTTVADVHGLTTLEGTAVFASGNNAFSQSKDLPKGQAQSSPDPDALSESYTHITPSSDEQPATPLSTETLEGADFTQEAERIAQERVNAECLLQEEEVSVMTPMMSDVGKQSDSPVDSGVGKLRTQKTAEEREPEFRRRRSLLAALERITKTEQEEEEFQLPQQEEDSGFSLNKCILGALILLGLGTIFFSGVFKDLDRESDYGTRELRDAEVQGNKEWLNPEVSPLSVEADTAQLLNKLTKENQQIPLLQAEIQAQKEELNVAKGQVAEERLRWEEVEKENNRLKKEIASLPDLQKENERMKKELESVLALQKEPETLRSTAPDLKVSSHAGAAEGVGALVNPTTSPSSGQLQDSMHGTAGATERQSRKSLDKQSEKKDKTERKKPEWKEAEHKDGGKSGWKKEKHDQGKFDKERKKEAKQKWHSDETKQWKEENWKKEKASRGDEGKQWKDREGKKEWKGKSERREWTEEKKTKHEKVDESKKLMGREERKDWKVRKEHEDEQKGREEWKKRKEDYKESGKYKPEKKDWKEKVEKKEWKKDGERTSKNGKVHSKEGKWKVESKQWEENKRNRNEMMGRDERRGNENERRSKNEKYDKVQKMKDEGGEWNERKINYDKELRKHNLGKDLNERNSENDRIAKEWKRKDERKEWGKKEQQNKGGRREIKDWTQADESSHKHKYENKSTGNHGHQKEQLWGDRKPTHTHRKPPTDQPEYWLRQQKRLQHNPKPAHHLKSVESFAHAEGLVPVPLDEFEVILQTYLAKAEEAGVEVSIREELKKLASQYFKDGVFVHDQMSFQDFAEDLGEVLEDIVEGDDEDEEGSALEEEMEEFEKVVIKRFSVPGAGEKENRSKGEWRKESGRGHG